MRAISRVLHAITFTCLFASLTEPAIAAFNWEAFTAPPRAIPFIEGGVTYTSFVQARHPHYNYNQIVYYPAGISDSLKPVGVDYNQGAPYQHLRILLNPASQNQAWDSEAYNPNVLVFYCFGNHDGSACQNSTWNSNTSTQIRNMQYTWFDWDVYGSSGAFNLQSDLVRSVGINVKINFSYNWNGQFGLGYLAAGDILIQGTLLPSNYLSFPLQVMCGNVLCTPFTAPVSAVMDHSLASQYEEDGIMLTFNNERGDRINGFHQGCYKKNDGSAFLVGKLNYVGTKGTGGKPYLCYDGHPGYDYPQLQGTDIFAPATGKLCVATIKTTQQSPANVWRNPTECGDIPDVVTTRWVMPREKPRRTNYNTFYIFHREYINGSMDDYMTVFLHSNSLENAVWSTVASQGYVNVNRNQHIAEVGKVGTGGNHLHIEVYKRVNGEWSRVDPYGDGTNNILWQR